MNRETGSQKCFGAFGQVFFLCVVLCRCVCVHVRVPYANDGLTVVGVTVLQVDQCDLFHVRQLHAVDYFAWRIFGLFVCSDLSEISGLGFWFGFFGLSEKGFRFLYKWLYILFTTHARSH